MEGCLDFNRMHRQQNQSCQRANDNIRVLQSLCCSNTAKAKRHSNCSHEKPTNFCNTG